MKNLTSRQQQAINTRIRITQAAMELFKTATIESVKIQDICNAASVSTGTFYHYFSSKEQIIVEGYNLIDNLIIKDFNSKECIDAIEEILWLNTCVANTISELGLHFISNCYRQILLDESQYTISPDRAVHKLLLSLLMKAKSQNMMSQDFDPIKLAESINKTTRGNIFDWCLKKGSTLLNDAIYEDVRNILFLYM